MVSLKININFFYKFFIIFFVTIFFNIFFYIIIEKFFLYSFVKDINNEKYYISFFLFFFFFLFSFFFIFTYYKKKKTEIVIKIFNLKIEKELKILLFINSIGILAFFILKLIPQYFFFSLLGAKTDLQNLSCILIETKNYTLERDSFFSNINNSFFVMTNKFSWIGTVLLNSFYVQIFFVILFFKKLNNKHILISIILILISISLYFVTTGGKIILLSVAIIAFTSLFFSYSLNLISFRSFLAVFSFILFTIISIYLISQLARTSCIDSKASYVQNYNSNIDSKASYVQNYNSNSEFNRKYFYRKTDSSINFINYSRAIINNNITVNYSLFYILSGKLSGDFLNYIDTNKKFNAGNFIYLKQVYNKIGSDLGKLGLQNFEYIKYDENFLERLNPIVSLYHMLFRDFGFLNLTILLFIFLLIFLQFKYIKNTVSLFIFTYFLLFLFYSVSGLGFANLAATSNTNIIFFNFFVFFFYFFLKVKILIK